MILALVVLATIGSWAAIAGELVVVKDMRGLIKSAHGARRRHCAQVVGVHPGDVHDSLRARLLRGCPSRKAQTQPFVKLAQANMELLTRFSTSPEVAAGLPKSWPSCSRPAGAFLNM